MLSMRTDLPTGEKEYQDVPRLKAWGLVQDKAARLLNLTPYGLDPHLTFSGPTGGQDCVMSPEAAVALATWHDRLVEAGLLAALPAPNGPITKEARRSPR